VPGEFEPDRPQPAANDGVYSWLFDSGRGYLEQIAAHKAYVRGDGMLTHPKSGKVRGSPERNAIQYGPLGRSQT
jgi:hypothetical protein